jgi:hypothetical protein
MTKFLFFEKLARQEATNPKTQVASNNLYFGCVQNELIDSLKWLS